jgi:hypothetical protein
MADFGDNHDFVRIDKMISETIDHMQKQLSQFDLFIQSKKGILQFIKAE